MSDESNTGTTSPSAPTWGNWSGNIVHKPATDGKDYYFMPKNLNDLKEILSNVSKIGGATIRMSGQRHSQPPLVTDDNRNNVPQTSNEYLVDMSCYSDLGPSGDQHIVLGPGTNQVTINTGVREDELDDFLMKNNLMMQTVTAGGFFSLGGMTAVDVHGATLKVGIFAETVSAFTILMADGSVTTIDAQTPAVGDWRPLQFARVSLGGLGMVTSVVLDAMPRPSANTLQGGIEELKIRNKSDFIEQMEPILTGHDRVETFFTPYANMPLASIFNQPSFLALWWDVDENTPREPITPPKEHDNACVLANNDPPDYGATILGTIAQFGAKQAEKSQYSDSILSPLLGPAVITAAATFITIKDDAEKANASNLELWLDGAVRVIFMSYFIPIPDMSTAGLGKVWDSLDVVAQIVTQDENFHIAAPMEFRFVKGGDSAMSGAYSDDPNAMFVNQDLIAFVLPDTTASEYPTKLLQFYADVERQWVAMGGFPHSGKMYGFYDPKAAPGSFSESGPFNPNYLADLKTRRGARQEAYNSYRKSVDPNGLFYNKYLSNLLGNN